MIRVRREREAVWLASNRYGRDHSSEIDVIHGDGIRAKVAHVEPCVIRTDQRARWLAANEMSAPNFVRACFDKGNTLAVEIADDEFSTVGFECQVRWGFAYVEKR